MLIALLLIAALQQPIKAPSPVSVERGDGGPVKSTLGVGFVINPNSTIHREYITIHNSSLPVDFIGVVGAKVGSEGNGNYIYFAEMPVKIKAAVSAIEIRLLVFDVWGNRADSLVMTDIADYPEPGQVTLKGEWRILRDADAAEHYASIAYISKVRLADGKVVVADVRPVLEEARKFSAKLTEADLEPPVPGPK